MRSVVACSEDAGRVPRRSARGVIGIFALVLGLLALAAPALAARGHEFTGTIGTPCTAEPCGPGELKEPTAVAVNEATGDVYVVDKFDSTGTPA
jgi:hypothetical protein